MCRNPCKFLLFFGKIAVGSPIRVGWRKDWRRKAMKLKKLLHVACILLSSNRPTRRYSGRFITQKNRRKKELDPSFSFFLNEKK